MARQTGPVFITGTIDNLTFYKMNGRYYVKKKTTVTRRRIYSNPRYTNTVRNATWFGRANTLARQVYYELPLQRRDQHKVWYPMLKRANALARLETPAAEFLRILREEFVMLLKTSIRLPEVIVKPVKQEEFTVGLIDRLAASYAFIKNIIMQNRTHRPSTEGMRHYKRPPD